MANGAVKNLEKKEKNLGIGTQKEAVPMNKDMKKALKKVMIKALTKALKKAEE